MRIRVKGGSSSGRAEFVSSSPERVAELPLRSSANRDSVAHEAVAAGARDDINGSSATRSPTQRTNAEASLNVPLWARYTVDVGVDLVRAQDALDEEIALL